MLLEARIAEAVAARVDDAQGVNLLIVEADGAGELEVLVALLRGQALEMLIEALQAALDDVELLHDVVVGLVLELVELELESLHLVVLVRGLPALFGTLGGAEDPAHLEVSAGHSGLHGSLGGNGVHGGLLDALGSRGFRHVNV